MLGQCDLHYCSKSPQVDVHVCAVRWLCAAAHLQLASQALAVSFGRQAYSWQGCWSAAAATAAAG